MTESVEYKTILTCFDKIVTALKSDPVPISNELVSANLISPVDCPQIDAQKLAQLLLDKIKLAPKRYYDVVRIFSRHDWLGDIVEILQAEQSKIEGNGEGQNLEPDSPAVSLGIVTDSSKPVHVEGETDDFKLDLDCPHRQSYLPVSNPVVRFEDLTEDDHKDLVAQMNDLTRTIHTKFKKLWDQVYESLRKRVSHKRIVLTLTGDEELLCNDSELRHAKDMFDVFIAMQPHCSYFNYDLLKLLVDVHGTHEDKGCLDEYIKSFASYCKAMPCAEEVCGSDEARLNRIKLMLKLNFDRQRLKADYVKDHIVGNIAHILKIRPSSLYLHSIKEGCVLLQFLISSCVFERIFPLGSEQTISLYKRVNLLTIQCDSPSLYVDIESEAKNTLRHRAGSNTDSSEYVSRVSDLLPEYQPTKASKRVKFDYALFYKKLEEMEQRDAEMIQLKEDYLHCWHIWITLYDEVEQLEEEITRDKGNTQDITEKLKLKMLERDLAHSKYGKALHEHGRRFCELKRDQLLHVLKMESHDFMKSEIKNRLEEAKRKLLWRIERVSHYQQQVSQHEQIQ